MKPDAIIITSKDEVKTHAQHTQGANLPRALMSLREMMETVKRLER